MTQKEELIKELEKSITICFNSKSPNNLFYMTFEQIADFIIAREATLRKRVLAPLMKHKLTVVSGYKAEEAKDWANNASEHAIEAAIAILKEGVV